MTQQEHQEYLEYKYKEVCTKQDYAMQVEGRDAQISALFDWLDALTDMVGTMICTG